MLIYLIENTINSKVYIGQTVRSIEQRSYQYKTYSASYAKNNLVCNSCIVRAMAKYGFDNFRFQIIDDAKTQEELDKLETWWIEIFNSRNKEIGYNIELGGHGKGRVSDKTKKKQSEIKLKEWQSPEYRQHMSEVHKGQKSWNKGQSSSEESKRKNSEAHKGKRSNPAGEFKKGEHISLNTEFKKGQVPWIKGKKGIVPWNKGIKLGPSPKKLFTEDQEKEIAAKYKIGNCTLKDLGKEYNCSVPTISKAIKKYSLQDRG